LVDVCGGVCATALLATRIDTPKVAAAIDFFIFSPLQIS